jgi:hypothetical protein
MCRCLPAYIILVLLLSSCGKNKGPDERAIYYWKTNFFISPEQSVLLHRLQIKKIYIRLFDVDWDKGINSPVPLGEIKFSSHPDSIFKVVPVVYITNKTLLNIADGEIPRLSENIEAQAKHIMESNLISYSELQFDCDWTEKTQIKYFSLINNIKSGLKKENKTICVTIRLHQIKYSEVTGIPPVDNGMLMFYNMGKIDSRDNENSIYNKRDAEKYTAFIKKYPIHLDVVLPLFGWVVHTREGKAIGLLNESLIEELLHDERFSKWGEKSYITNESFFLHGNYFIKGDILKVEKADIGICREAADLVSRNLAPGIRTVSIFDYDSLKISTDYEKDFEKIFGLFN